MDTTNVQIAPNSKISPPKGDIYPIEYRLEFTACPLCQADEPTPFLYLKDWGYQTPGDFTIVQCSLCELYYLNPRPSPANIQRHYPGNYAPYRPAIEDEVWSLMRFMRRRKLVKKRNLIETFTSKDKGTLLDIGCSTGLFLAEMQNAGWETYGIDINEEAASYARNRFGLNVAVGRLSDAEFQVAMFDVICLWDVLEHTFNPLDILIEAHRILKPEGIVVCIVPNADSLDRYLFRASWVGYDAPRHLTIFSPSTLRALFYKAHFQIDCLRCDYGGYFSFITSLRIWLNRFVASAIIRQIILHLVNLPGMRLPFEPIFKSLDYFGYGNELLIIGRKTSS